MRSTCVNAGRTLEPPVRIELTTARLLGPQPAGARVYPQASASRCIENPYQLVTAPISNRWAAVMASSQDIHMPDPAICSSTLMQWRTAMISAGLARRTIADRIRTLTRFESEMRTPVLSADVMQISDWIGARPDISSSTRAAYHSMLSAFFKWACLVELRKDNPMDKIKAAKRPRRSPRPVSDRAFHSPRRGSAQCAIQTHPPVQRTAQ